jgi:hypothetical protein
MRVTLSARSWGGRAYTYNNNQLVPDDMKSPSTDGTSNGTFPSTGRTQTSRPIRFISNLQGAKFLVNSRPVLLSEAWNPTWPKPLLSKVPAQFAEFLEGDYDQILVKFTYPPESVLVRQKTLSWT